MSRNILQLGSSFSALALALASTVSCVQTASPADLVSSVPPSNTGTTTQGGEGLATPDAGVAPPAACALDAGAVPAMSQVNVPAGEFAMGCNAKSDTECASDEKPEHMVQLDAFSIDITEVSQAQYQLCIQAGKCTNPYCAWDPCTNPNLPIACVYREQAMDYCAYVGEALPTEAQWEKAARGTDGRVYPWGNQSIACNLANVYGCGNGTRDVGTLPDGVSPYGAFDMAGNVVEWTLDVYDATYYTGGLATNPTGPAATSTSSYVGRGGGWRSDDQWQRTSARDQYEPLYVKDSMGFRCVGKALSATAAVTQ